jgi:hypothetical protein
MQIDKRIRRGTVWSGLAIVATASAALWALAWPPGLPARGQQKSNDLVVHEWGTFLGMNGSDGASLDGMYHEEHALPAFVHSRSKDQLRMPGMFLKGETPVIYFYTSVQQPVHVGVVFPRGIWTQWYPQASRVRPALIEQAEKPDRAGPGRICWSAEVIPASRLEHLPGSKPGAASEPAIKLPATSSDALWNHARQVDAAFVKTLNAAAEPAIPEFERFLFYRGLGEARLPLKFDEAGNGGLTLERGEPLGDGVRHVFVVRVENGRGAYSYRPLIRPGQQVHGVIPSMHSAQSLADFTSAIAKDLAARLVETGLYAKEARAMVNTWATSYFQSEGIRALFVLPQCWTDAFIPMEINPKPRQVVRVMVGRLELLTAERERLAENAVRSLGSHDPSKRQQAFRFLNEQGRYVEPIVRRVLKTTEDEEVKSLCRRLLLTEFVTELRAAVHNAADGKRLNADPLLLRAHLARLLRDIGLRSEARSEGDAILAALRVHPTELNQVQSASPWLIQVQAASPCALEIRAAALEAKGDDRTASRFYARRIELRTQELSANFDLDAFARLRDWWVGRAYAQCLQRTGTASATIATLERRLAGNGSIATDRSDLRATRVLLAYLLDGQSKPDLADTQWSLVAGKTKLKAAANRPIPEQEDRGESGS